MNSDERLMERLTSSCLVARNPYLWPVGSQPDLAAELSFTLKEMARQIPYSLDLDEEGQAAANRSIEFLTSIYTRDTNLCDHYEMLVRSMTCRETGFKLCAEKMRVAAKLKSVEDLELWLNQSNKLLGFLEVEKTLLAMQIALAKAAGKSNEICIIGPLIQRGEDLKVMFDDTVETISVVRQKMHQLNK